MSFAPQQKRIIDRCIELYTNYFNTMISNLNETDAQRNAIAKSFVDAINEFGVNRSTEVWRAIQSAHVKRKSGTLIDFETIQQVSSANQSWNKSSGHAFEQSFCSKINSFLKNTKIKFLLQREVSEAIGSNQILNKARDMETINGWLQSSAFDVYAIIEDTGGKATIFGCVQCKTSIRDRVTRDREPSLQAMSLHFWSIAVVVDGDFLKLPKFTAMVNGGTSDYPKNGWHGMYSFSEATNNARIFALTDELQPLVKHANAAAKSWEDERQWVDVDWKDT
jgi:hypothetical protein